MTQEYPISNVKGITMSNFGCAYNPVGTQYALTYDAADQLVVNSNAYAYDLMGNRLAETTQSGTNVGRFNILNQLAAYTSSSVTQTVSGHTSSPITSGSIDTVPVTVSNGTNFTANVAVPMGTNVITVQAQNSAGTSVEQKVQAVTSAGTAPVALTYDLNGNARADEYGNTYTWDALNRLIKIAYIAGGSSNFAYDGASRRIAIVEKNSSGTVTSTKLYLWVGNSIVDERNSTNVVQKRFYPQGEQQAGTAYFYTKDHLGSVRELISAAGAIVSRLSYDIYGRMTIVSGTVLPTFQYGGYYNHVTSGLYLTNYRAYDPNTGRWLSRDLIAESGGINLYAYCGNNPINAVDPSGLVDKGEVIFYDPAGTSFNQEQLLRFAITLRDFQGRLSYEKYGTKVATVIAAFDIQTHQVAVASAGNGNCAETNAYNGLIIQGSDPKNIRFTSAVRPRYLAEGMYPFVTTCPTCVSTYGESDFIEPGNTFGYYDIFGNIYTQSNSGYHPFWEDQQVDYQFYNDADNLDKKNLEDSQ